LRICAVLTYPGGRESLLGDLSGAISACRIAREKGIGSIFSETVRTAGRG
jgi:hypothetical protein